MYKNMINNDLLTELIISFFLKLLLFRTLLLGFKYTCIVWYLNFLKNSLWLLFLGHFLELFLYFIVHRWFSSSKNNFTIFKRIQ